MGVLAGRRRLALAAGLAALLVAAVIGTQLNQAATPPGPVPGHNGLASGASALPAAPLPGVAGAASAAAGASPAVPPAAGGDGGTGEVAVRYRFDRPLTASVADDGGRLPLKVKAAAHGGLSTEAHAGGRAVRFPKRCLRYGAPSCPRAILQSGPAEALNPRTRPVRFGAAVRLGAGETSVGENVLQKGYSQGDSQFKLQIDGAAGRPSCVLVGAGSPAVYVLTADRTVADGLWHSVECARAATSLTIMVDGVVAGRRGVPAGLAIVNREPLRIGGKGTSPNNDQFHGAIDDAYVVIGQ
jgi:hypothetical protein